MKKNKDFVSIYIPTRKELNKVLDIIEKEGSVAGGMIASTQYFKAKRKDLGSQDVFTIIALATHLVSVGKFASNWGK